MSTHLELPVIRIHLGNPRFNYRFQVICLAIVLLRLCGCSRDALLNGDHALHPHEEVGGKGAEEGIITGLFRHLESDIG